jgi:hypothetical protein
MVTFEEAQTAFQEAPDLVTARTYHRVAWKSYVDNTINEFEFSAAMIELELWLMPVGTMN